MIIIKSDPEVDLMRQAGRITAGARTVARQMVEPGVTTRQTKEVEKRTVLAKFINVRGVVIGAVVIAK